MTENKVFELKNNDSKHRCRVCGDENKAGTKTCNKKECKKKGQHNQYLPTGRVSVNQYTAFREALLNSDEGAVEIARLENLEQVYSKELNRLWVDEGVVIDLELLKTLKYPEIYRGIRGKVEEPYTDNERHLRSSNELELGCKDGKA